MIQVELLDEEDGDCLAMPKWSAVPDVGERFTTGECGYIIVSREWGVCCQGDGSSVWGQQCVTLVLRKHKPDSSTSSA